MKTYRGITWDHPRGRNALLASAKEEQHRDSGLRLEWTAHSLERFESHPIDDLAQTYDLIVLDHPHLGEAVEHQSLTPLDEVFGLERLERWSRQSVGPSFDSYSSDGHQWALPLDAATQVAVRKPARVSDAPTTWNEVDVLSTTVPTALSLAGPHAFLTFASICAAYGAPPSDPDCGGEGITTDLVPDETAVPALELMRSLGSRAPEDSLTQNPISLLQRMTDTDDIAFCPLVYGYVNYSSPDLLFSDAPCALPGGRHGSTIGGTGLAISARTEITPLLIEHIEWLMSANTQRSFIPYHDGQPSNRDAWLDDEVNHTSSGFYRSTLATIEDSWVRPRFSGYIPFQSTASAIIRTVVTGHEGVESGLARLRAEFVSALPVTTERA